MTSLLTSDISCLDKIKRKQLVIKYMPFVSIYRHFVLVCVCPVDRMALSPIEREKFPSNMVMTFGWSLFIMQMGFAAASALIYPCSSNQTCGCSLNAAVLTRIIGGEQAETDTWSWTVSIRVDHSHICGGTLISSTLVLTAAHCLKTIKSLSSLKVNIGSKYVAVIRQQRFVSNIYLPRNHIPNTFVDDIAVIRLSSAVDMTDRSVAYICLPTVTNREYPPVGTPVIAVGWGVLTPFSRTPSSTLRQVALRTVSPTAASCHAMIYNTNSQLCAGVQGGGKGMQSEILSIHQTNERCPLVFSSDTCQGDSGGPLMMFSNGHWELIGITSYGSGCGSADYSGVYTRVSQYSDWISCFLSNDTSCIRDMTLKPSFSHSSPGRGNVHGNILRCFLSMTLLILIIV